MRRKQSKVQCAKNQHRNRVENRARDGKRIWGALECGGMRCVGWCGKAKQSAVRQKSAQKITSENDAEEKSKVQGSKTSAEDREEMVSGQVPLRSAIVSDIPTST